MPSLVTDSLNAHALRFEKPLAPAYDDGAGLRVLVAFILVGIGLPFLLRFAFDATGVRGSPGANLGFVVAWLAAFFLVHRWFVRLPMAAVGPRGPGSWTRRERLYFAQVVPVAALGFAVLFRDHLVALHDRHGLAGFVLFSVVGGLVWGIGQELIYRGWLQTELTRRFGAIAGLLVANLVFTFGPLHFGLPRRTHRCALGRPGRHIRNRPALRHHLRAFRQCVDSGRHARALAAEHELRPFEVVFALEQ